MSERAVTRAQWGAIADAEDQIYGDDAFGVHAYTEVNEWADQQPLVGELWAWAELHVEQSIHQDVEPEDADRVIAERVATALSVLAFGPEFLADVWPDVGFLGYGDRIDGRSER